MRTVIRGPWPYDGFQVVPYVPRRRGPKRKHSEAQCEIIRAEKAAGVTGKALMLKYKTSHACLHCVLNYLGVYAK